MANENTSPITYADWAKTRDPEGNTADIVEMLSESNPIIEDATVLMGNLTDGHKTTVRTGIPHGTWRKLYQGVQPSKSQVREIKDTVGMLENYIEVDKSLADLEDDRAAFMMQESAGVMEGMGQDHMETLIYGDTAVNPERFTGFMPRYNDATADSARNVINGSPGGAVVATDTCTSIYLFTWGARTMFEIFPKGSNVGLTMRDLGEQTMFDATDGRYQGYRTHFKHDLGFVLRDWRYGARIANMSEAQIQLDNIDLITLLIKAAGQIQSPGRGTAVFYCNRAVYSSLDVKANQKSNVWLSMIQWGSQQVVAFRGMPIRVLEGLDFTEEFVPGLPTNIP